MKIIQHIIVVAAMIGMLSTISAQTTNIILQTDFDGDAGQGNLVADTPTYAFIYAGTDASGGQNGGAPLPVFVNYQDITNGIGVGGSYAFQFSPDYTDLATDPGWLDATTWATAEIAGGVSFGAPINPITPTSALDSLILSADVQSVGVVSGQYGANVLINSLQFKDVDGNIIFDFNGYGTWASTSGFTHLSVPLSNLTYASDSLNPVTDLTNADVVGSIVSFTVVFQVSDLVGTIGAGGNQEVPIFGFTNTGALLIDNIELAQIVNTNPPTPPTPTVEQTIWQANYDTTFPTGSYGYHDRDGNDTASGNWAVNPTGGIGGSASSEYTVDLSSWSTNPPSNYSGFGIGANENPIPYTLTSSSKASYRLYFSAKVGGTSDGVTSVPAQIDLSFFNVTTNTTIEVYDLVSTFALSTNWQSFVFDGGTNMQVATWNAQFQQLFNQNVTNVNQIEVQLGVNGSPNIATLFGYDADNTIDIDNIKVVQLVPGLAPLTIVQTNGQTQITWADPTTGGTAKLQSATSVAGPYTDVAGASSATASPYTVPSGGQQQFYRTVWIP